MQSTEPSTNVQKTRVQHIDIAKGIGILLVALGHIPTIMSNDKGKLYNIIYSFHLPLFFFLSGLFFNSNTKLTGLMMSRFHSLIKPYLAVSIIFMLPEVFIKKLSIIDYLTGVIYSSGDTIVPTLTPLWFITHLWAVSIFSWLFIKATKLNSIKNIYQVFILFLLLIIGVFNIVDFWRIPVNTDMIFKQILGKQFLLSGLPFSIDIVFVSSFFFLLGFLLKQEVINFKFQAKSFIFTLILFCSCHYWFNYSLQLYERRYDNLIISTLEAFSGIYIVLSVSTLLSKYKGIKQIFAYIGSGSLFILMFDIQIQYQAFVFLVHHFYANYFDESCAFIIGCVVSLLLWELVKSNYYLSLLFLPPKSNKTTLLQKS